MANADTGTQVETITKLKDEHFTLTRKEIYFAHSSAPRYGYLPQSEKREGNWTAGVTNYTDGSVVVEYRRPDPHWGLGYSVSWDGSNKNFRYSTLLNAGIKPGVSVSFEDGEEIKFGNSTPSHIANESQYWQAHHLLGEFNLFNSFVSDPQLNTVLPQESIDLTLSK